MRRFFAAIFCVSAVACRIEPVDAASDRGLALAAVCAACHRLDAGWAGGPRITGWPAADLEAKLKSFRQGAGDNHVMTTLSRTLSDEDIATVARYLSTVGKEDARR